MEGTPHAIGRVVDHAGQPFTLNIYFNRRREAFVRLVDEGAPITGPARYIFHFPTVDWLKMTSKFDTTQPAFDTLRAFLKITQ